MSFLPGDATPNVLNATFQAVLEGLCTYVDDAGRFISVPVLPDGELYPHYLAGKAISQMNPVDRSRFDLFGHYGAKCVAATSILWDFAALSVDEESCEHVDRAFELGDAFGEVAQALIE